MKDLYKNWLKQYPVLKQVERRGLHYDVAIGEQSIERAATDIAIREKQLEPWVFDFQRQLPEPLNWNSVSHRQAFFYDYLRFDIPKYCGSGQAVRINRERKRTTDSVTIEGFIRAYPEHEANLIRLQQLQRAKKLLQFLTKLPAHISKHTGRIHTDLAPRTVTGRLSSRTPNLQQIPVRNDKYGIRNGFTAPPGKSLVVLDYSQLEMYLTAHFLLSELGDRSVLNDLLSSDVHTSVALRVWGDESRRSDAKAIVYGLSYGKTDVGFGASLTDDHGEPIGREKAREFLDAYFDAYPGILKLQEIHVTRARERGYTETLSGRKRYLDYGTEEWHGRAADRKAMNTPNQGGAADIVTNALIACSHLPMVLQVHDELVFEVETEKAPAVLAEAKERMENAGKILGLLVPLHVEGGIYDSWGLAK